MDEVLMVIAALLLLGSPLIILALLVVLFQKVNAQRRRIDDLERRIGHVRDGEIPAKPVSAAPPVTAPPPEEAPPVEKKPPPLPAAVPPPLPVSAPESVVEDEEATVGVTADGDIGRTERVESVLAALRAAKDTPEPEPDDDAAAAAPRDSLEVQVGQRLFNRVGIGVLVIGVVLILRYTIDSMGGWGRIIASALTGLAMIGSGLFLQHRDRYRHAALGLIAGGWAVIYVLAYAVHNLEAVRKIEDPRLGFGLLALVAAGMIAHSLRHRVPVITALTFVFAVVGMTFSPPGPWIPVAVGVVGLAQIIVSRFRPYHDLGPIAVIITYGAQLVWLSRLDFVAPPTTQWAFLVQSAAFALGAALVPLVENRRPQRSGLTGLINLGAAFTLVMLAEGSIGHPGPWIFPLFLAAVAFAEGWLRWRRGLSLVLGAYSLGAATVFVMVAVLWAFSAGWSQALWLILAILVTWIGRLQRAPALATLGAAIIGVSLLWILATSLGMELETIPVGPLEPRWTLLLAAVALHGFRVLARDTRVAPLGTVLALAGTAVAIAWVPLEAPETLSTLFLAAFALALYAHALWQRDVVVRMHGIVVALIAGLVTLAAHVQDFRLAFSELAALPISGALWGLPAPIVWTMVPAGALYFLWWVRWPYEADTPVHLQQDDGVGTLALTLVLALLYTLCPSALLSIAWAILAIALVCMIGPISGRPLLTLHGLLTSILAGGHLFLVNFTTSQPLLVGLTLRHATVVPVLATLIYLRQRIRGVETPSGPHERLFRFLHRVAGCLIVAVTATLMSYELSVSMVAPSWALIAFAAIWIGSQVEDRSITISGCLLLGLAAVRGIAVHRGLDGSFFGVPVHIVATVPVVLALIASGERLRSLWRRRVEAGKDGTDDSLATLLRRAPQIYPALVTLFIATYIYRWVSGPWLTFAWTIEAFLVLGLGILLRSRPYRWCGLGLICFCLGKVFIVDLAGLEPEHKIISFVILGIVMIGISFLYARFRSKIAEYL